MKYKALITDVDGTLIVNKPDGFPTKKVINTIGKTSGIIHFGIATSRCFENAGYLIDHLKLSGPLILEGGGLIYDPEKKKIISEHALLENELIPLQEFLNVVSRPFEYCDNKDKHKIFPKKGKVPKKAFMVFAQAVDKDDVEELVNDLLKVPNVAVHTTPSWTLGKNDVLITHAEATKQHGILEVSQILGIETHEIIGVGDGNNDFPLLMACGLKIAMGNATEDLKAIADYIAPTVEEDGLAHVIEKFVLKN